MDVITFGQYMRPTKRHLKVDSYVPPETFDAYARQAEALGFLYVASGPLVRSSFKAGELLRSAAGKRLVKGLGGRVDMGKIATPPAAGIDEVAVAK